MSLQAPRGGPAGPRSATSSTLASAGRWTGFGRSLDALSRRPLQARRAAAVDRPPSQLPSGLATGAPGAEPSGSGLPLGFASPVAIASGAPPATLSDPYADSADLPRTYNKTTLAAYWNARPAAVASRVAVVGAVLARAAARSPSVGAPAALREAFVTLGPAFVKAGQVLATRADLVGEDMAEGLKSLQQGAPPFSASEAKACLEAAGLSASDLCIDLEAGPVAAASLGQVYKGRLSVDRAGEWASPGGGRPGFAGDPNRKKRGVWGASADASTLARARTTENEGEDPGSLGSSPSSSYRDDPEDPRCSTVEVAVKLQRPGAARAVSLDVHILRASLNAVSTVARMSRDLGDIADFVGERCVICPSVHLSIHPSIYPSIQPTIPNNHPTIHPHPQGRPSLKSSTTLLKPTMLTPSPRPTLMSLASASRVSSADSPAVECTLRSGCQGGTRPTSRKRPRTLMPGVTSNPVTLPSSDWRCWSLLESDALSHSCSKRAYATVIPTRETLCSTARAASPFSTSA